MVTATSHKNRTEYFINLRRSYHFQGSQETHIFLKQEDGSETADQFQILLSAKGLLEQDLNQLEGLLLKLQEKLDSYRFGLPTLTIQSECKQYEAVSDEIDTLVIRLKGHLRVFKEEQKTGTSSCLVKQFRENLGIHLANKLTFQFEKFQMFRKMFKGLLYDRQNESKDFKGQEEAENSFQQPEPDQNVSSTFQQQVVLDASDQLLLKERDQEIEKVVQDVNYIHDVMNQIQVMTVEQVLRDYSDLPVQPIDPHKHLSSSVSTIDELLEWRISDRTKSVAAGLVLCLNLGIDPPDSIKPSPCACWECWVDPNTGLNVERCGNVPEDGSEASPTEAVKLHLHGNGSQPISTGSASVENTREVIARALLQQYEQWQPRVRYKTLIDPTVEDFRKLCVSLRKSARHERVLMHYNGHGVPKPTRNAEFWVFNKQFTQYIPVNIADAAEWLGLPAVWVLDCPGAGYLLQALQRTSESIISSKQDLDLGNETSSRLDASSTLLTQRTSSTDSQFTSTKPIERFEMIAFAACEAQESLPLTPAMPADILTSCLTTPLDMAIRWHCYNGGSLLPSIDIKHALKIPGRLNDRRTALGELNWIFTAITDTIAWLVLPRDTFRRLYRQDLLIASLSRNFLLAQRILKSMFCQALSLPRIPATHQHPLWTLWDHVLDSFLTQIPVDSSAPNRPFQQSTFFTDQLDAFELWLEQHKSTAAPLINGPPDQLPSALQILLSQNLRPRALGLLARFCDFGAWACLECLHVGIHPYILKLLQTGSSQPLNSPNVAGPLCHIWARLLAIDPGCRGDLMKESSFRYLVHCLESTESWACSAAAALAVFAHDHLSGREKLLECDGIYQFLNHQKIRPDVLKWQLILLAELWAGAAVEPEIIHRLTGLGTKDLPGFFNPFLRSESVAIRSAAIYAIGRLVEGSGRDQNSSSSASSSSSFESSANDKSHVQLNLCKLLDAAMNLLTDASPAVRLELVVLLSKWESFSDDSKIWESIKVLAFDPFAPVAQKAQMLLQEEESSSSSAAPSQALQSNLLQYFLSNELEDCAPSYHDKDVSFAPDVRYSARLSAKAAVLNEFQVESWRERPQSSRKLDYQLNVIDLDADIHETLFHPLLPQIYTTDDCNQLNCWNWEDGSNLSSVQFTSEVSGMSLLPLQQRHLLCASTVDGQVHLLPTLKPGHQVAISAFSLPDRHVKCTWNCEGLLAAGNSRFYLYDPKSENISQSREFAQPSGNLTSLATLNDSTWIAHAHSIEGIDLRADTSVSLQKLSPSSSIVHLWSPWPQQLAAATSDGQIHCWDLRKNSPGQRQQYLLYSIQTSLACFTSHPTLPNLIACGSVDQYIKLIELSPAGGTEASILQVMKYHEGFLGQRLGPIGTLTFHPHRPLLATTTSDSILSIYGMKPTV